jgi:hypothetical protein
VRTAIASPSPLADVLQWVGSRCLSAAEQLRQSVPAEPHRPAEHVPHEDIVFEMRDRILTRYY